MRQLLIWREPLSKHGMMVIPHPISTLPTKNGSTETMAVLTYNLLSYSGEAIWKENCTEVYRLEEKNGWKIIHSHWSLTKPSIG
ncbi:hypothetical protein [Petrimonas sp.]|uniref:hypothetical protein n=1 Tax=Petrimonas sp. TaxID=2023866 RepID=UPI003322C70E